MAWQVSFYGCLRPCILARAEKQNHRLGFLSICSQKILTQEQLGMNKFRFRLTRRWIGRMRRLVVLVGNDPKKVDQQAVGTTF